MTNYLDFLYNLLGITPSPDSQSTDYQHYDTTNNGSLEYSNGRWFYNGELAPKGLQFKRTDGYWYGLNDNGTMNVLDIDDNRNPIPHSYIGGTTEDARDTYWEESPVMRHATDSISSLYGIDAETLRHRLNKEGFTDELIRKNNKKGGRQYSTYYTLNKDLRNLPIGPAFFGLDDVNTYINEGKVVPSKGTNYSNGSFTNEKGRITDAASGYTMADNMSLMGATLKFFKNQAKKDFPNASEEFLNKASEIYYNRGIEGGREYLKKRKK